MQLSTKTISASLPPAVKSLRPSREEFARFDSALTRYLGLIDERETEENHKTHLIDVLKAVFPPEIVIEQLERIDCVIRTGGRNSPPAVLIESKSIRNRSEMISVSDLNRKAMHEAVIYYMRQRDLGNISVRKIVICSTYEFFVFDARQFERAFYANAEFRRQYNTWADGLSSDERTEFFYRYIAYPYISESD